MVLAQLPKKNVIIYQVAHKKMEINVRDRAFAFPIWRIVQPMMNNLLHQMVVQEQLLLNVVTENVLLYQLIASTKMDVQVTNLFNVQMVYVKAPPEVVDPIHLNVTLKKDMFNALMAKLTVPRVMINVTIALIAKLKHLLDV